MRTAWAQRLASYFAVAAALLVTLAAGPLASAAMAQNPPGAVQDGWDTQDGMPLSETSPNDAVAPPGGSTPDETSSPSPPDTSTSSTSSTSSATPDTSGDVYGSREEPGGLTGMVLDWFKTIMGFVYDSTVGDLIGKVGEALQAGILGLPAPSGEVASMYEGMVGAMRPVILVGILITALLMMLRTSNYDVAYAGFHALPKFIGVAVAFAFLPEFMRILSEMTLDISGALLPSGERALTGDVELFEATLSNLTAPGGLILNIVLAIAFTIVGFMVVLVAMLKNILFQMLFIAGPFALASSIIPGVSHLAASWFRGVLACAAIPIFWSLELGIGTVIVSSPGVLFGQMVNVLGSWSDGIFTSLGAIVILWVMYKTPFKVLEWAFESYDSSRGAWRGLARSVMIGVAATGVRSGIRTLAGAAAGGGAGAAAGAAAGGSSETSSAASRTNAGGSGSSRGGLGRGKGIRLITGQAAATRAAGAIGSGEGSSQSRGKSSQLADSSGAQGSGQGSGQGALGGRGEQKALPPASPAIQQKFLKQKGTAPGMGQPSIKPKRSPLSQKRRKAE